MLELRPHAPEDAKEGVVITFVDITEVKEAEQELAEKVELIKKLQRQIISNDISERWKIGRFLHDDLAQTLVLATYRLKNMKNTVENGEKVAEEDIDQLLDIISEAMKGTRNLSHKVVPVDVEDKGMAHAFNNLARRLEKVHDIHCTRECDNNVDNLENLEVATYLYRIAHEAAKNAAVHGDADNVKITLKSDNGYLYLNIEDDGSGFSGSWEEDEGMGLHIMRHRMDLVGGTIDIKNASDIGGTGATISCKCPIGKG